MDLIPSSMMKTMLTPVASPNLRFALKLLRYAYPTIVFSYFFIALGITVCYMQAEKSRIRDQFVRRGMILWLIASLTGTYAVEIVVAIIKSLVEEGWDPGQDRVVYLISSTLVFLVEIIALADTKVPTWYPYYGTWFIGLFVELCLAIFPNVFFPPTNSTFDYILITLQAIRIFNLIALPVVYFYLHNSGKTHDPSDTERQSLLKKTSAPSSSESSTLNGNGYGATDEVTVQGAQSAEDGSDTASVTSEDSYLEQQRQSKKAVANRLKQDGNWWAYLRGFSMLIPFLWPVSDRKLQFRAVLVGIAMLSSNAFNVLVPIQFGIMVQSLITYTGGDHSHNIWTPVLLYSLLRFINGGSCLTVVRAWLWTPLEQYAYKTLSSAAHSHIMSLSSDFHDSKSSADLFQVVNGGRSVADLMETLFFQVIPMLIDLVIAFIYFGAFGPYMFLVLVVTFVSYMYTTVKLISMRADQRRKYVTFYRKEWTVGQESLDGWTTANLFNMVPYENQRYSGVIKEHIDSKWAYEWFHYITSIAKSLIMCFGLTGVLCLGVYAVVYEGQTVGKFTTLLMFWGQLQAPLAFLASTYKTISSSLMDAERLLEIFKTEPSIKEAPGAKELEISKCEIEFNDVCFSYDERKPILKNVGFFAPGGKTIAFVGETGGGKSTMLKLMDRFYDVKSGSIKIDGQDIREITMHSLRSHVGVVPQDPTLFNDTVMNNIRYARLDATDEEVYEACKAAAVHDKIMKFANGYNSKVGDRGVKLSGGEKQRVAIARAILKQPTIILLDEATSAVDTETEQQIQKGLRALCKGRTTFVVAHRLSTVMNADHIVVIMDGQIVEQGSHDELFHSKGKYADLWAKQIFVKPSDRKPRSRSRSKSAAKKDATIVNDLTTQDKTVDLAKAAKGVEDHHHAKDNDNDNGEGLDDDTSSSDQPKDESKRKAESFKPALLQLKTYPSHFKSSHLNGPKLPSSNVDLRNLVVAQAQAQAQAQPQPQPQPQAKQQPQAQAKAQALTNILRLTPIHRPAQRPAASVGGNALLREKVRKYTDTSIASTTTSKTTTTTATAAAATVSELTPLLVTQDSRIGINNREAATQNQSQSPWKERKKMFKELKKEEKKQRKQKKGLAKEKEKEKEKRKVVSLVSSSAASSSRIVGEGITVVSIDTGAGTEFSQASSLIQSANVMETEMGMGMGMGTVIKDRNMFTAVGGGDGVMETYPEDIHIPNSKQRQNRGEGESEEEDEITDITVPVPAQVAANMAVNSQYSPRNRNRNRRRESKSEAVGWSGGFGMGLDGIDGVEKGKGGIGVSGSGSGSGTGTGTGESMDMLEIGFSHVGEGDRVGGEGAKITARKGILKNSLGKKRRVSAPAGDREREKVLCIPVPELEIEMERERESPTSISSNTATQAKQHSQYSQRDNACRKMYMAGGMARGMGSGLMRGKRIGWRIRSRVVEGMSALGNGDADGDGDGSMNGDKSLNGAKSKGVNASHVGGGESGGGVKMGMDLDMDGAGGLEGCKMAGGEGGGEGGGHGNGSGNVKGKGKGKARGSVRFADDA
ncbi:hypothetical protein SBOR_4850 [Sclerotinia borealis F-4128]|uniref:Heavy metal tolerance protein n=1 Tax=Sclerotinia borealis (strain F-4128) TaxID=1432307 RepID=W9CFQ0_SCLBF|nr:hypothetical protein SBOR_4850 [Sclerotinia borealis F-4128]